MNPKQYLYLDTSEEEATIILFEEGGQIVSELKWQAGRELSKTLSQKFDELLSGAGTKKEAIKGVLIFTGPGSFTGLRIGISFANALAFGLAVPVFEANKKATFKLGEPKDFALPMYGSEPKITKPKKFCD